MTDTEPAQPSPRIPADSWLRKKRWTIPIGVLVLLTLLVLLVPADEPADSPPAATPATSPADSSPPAEAAPAEVEETTTEPDAPPEPSTEPPATPEPVVEPSPTPESAAIPTGPGEPTVYESIAAITDCAQLQEQFNIAAANNEREEPGTNLFDATLSYMTFTDQRLRELDCY